MSSAEGPPREDPPHSPCVQSPGAQSAGAQSPCIQVCVMGERGLCRGCKRTLGEIARWSTMCDGEKRAVLAALPARGSGG